MEMAGNVALELVEKGLVTDQITLTLGYDIENLTNPEIRSKYHGRVSVDHYGRQVPYHSHGTSNFPQYTSSSRLLTDYVEQLFRRIANPILLVRRITISINRLIPKEKVAVQPESVQLDLFTDYEAKAREEKKQEETLDRENRRLKTINRLRQKFGKNIILSGLNFAEGATQRERNGQIGGHKA